MITSSLDRWAGKRGYGEEMKEPTNEAKRTWGKTSGTIWRF